MALGDSGATVREAKSDGNCFQNASAKAMHGQGLSLVIVLLRHQPPGGSQIRENTAKILRDAGKAHPNRPLGEELLKLGEEHKCNAKFIT